MVFAVIETGGKQYKVKPGSVVTIEKLAGTEGETITFEKVLMYAQGAEPIVGSPYVDGVTVTAQVMSQHRGPKIRVFTYKPKKRQRRTIGHRQSQTQVKVTAILEPKPATKAKSTKAATE